MAEENNRWRIFLFGVLLGGVIGSVLTFLVADKVRRQLRERGIDISGKLDEVVATIREKGDEFLSRAREVVKEAVKEGKEVRSELEKRFKKEE